MLCWNWGGHNTSLPCAIYVINGQDRLSGHRCGGAKKLILAIKGRLHEPFYTVGFGFLTFAGMRNYGCSPLLVPLASDCEGGVEGVVLSLESLAKGFALMAAIMVC